MFFLSLLRFYNSKATIATQKRVGEETSHVLEKLPKIKAYLHRHKELFLNRKSSIYNGKPMSSIFGVGDYSFKPYKVAISGLYKQTKFTLVKPNGTVLLLDETCYFIGFANHFISRENRQLSIFE